MGSLSEYLISGIRSAVARKLSKPPREAISTIQVGLVAKAVKNLFPTIKKLHLVGSRLRHKVGRDLDFVAVVDDEKSMPTRNVTTTIGSMKLNVFFSLPSEVETHILEFGLGFDIMRWKRAAIKKGFKLNRYGLWKKGIKVTGSMRRIATLIGMPLKPHLVYSLKHPL
jgi:DNA polymerase/3'-5' exonuclease PolX